MKLRIWIGLRNTVVGVLLGVSSLPLYAQEWVYTVRPGDTLWDLIDKYSVNLIYVPQLQALNKIENPKRIRPGSTLRIPVKWLKSQPVSVTVVSVVGHVMAERSNNPEPTTLRAGDTLAAGDSVTTGSGSNAVFQFADDSQLILRQDSELVFDTLSQYGDTGMVDTRARLQRGRAEAAVGKLIGGGSRYEIHTPAAISAVRGTGYRIGADSEQPVTRTEVLEGNVDVAGGGESQRVPQGFGTVVEKGKPPEPPRELLVAPDLSAMPTLVERVPLKFEWPQLDGAIGYRFQLADREDFAILMDDRQTEQARVHGVAVAADGEYILRIRGFDDAAVEGRDAAHRFTLNARPEPPFPMQPEPDKALRHDRPEFKWSMPLGAVAYRFEMAQNDQFDSLLLDQEITDSPKIRHHAQVAAETSARPHPPASAPSAPCRRHLAVRAPGSAAVAYT